MAFPPDRPRAHPVHLVALGATVEVRVDGNRAAEAVAEIERVWHLCAAPDDDDNFDAVVRMTFDDASADLADIDAGVVQGRSLPNLMQVLTQAVTRAAIDAQKGHLVMLHAAGIQCPDTGAVVALVGPGGTGKTTLIRTLGPGKGYITDETVAVTADDIVLPYPKPLSVRREPGSMWKDETDPLEFGVLPPLRSAPLAAVVLLDRQDGYAGPPAVEPVDTLDAIAALTPETSHLPELEKPLQRMAALCDNVGGVMRVTYAEAEHLAPLVHGWLGAGS
ncbi:hypothetical protein [Pedococcus cremeus]|uniref:hypothetical protein n=1 Tax=Pedococcus cremeus TaxID=587636 RepID=UPI00115FA73E|nr:hypothetical protein [Pedococcus cremeus]